MPPAMELRKSSSRRAPKRYEDELEDHSPPPPVKTRPRAYRGEVIEYNPSLPPAAFPTLDPRELAHEYQQQPENHAPKQLKRPQNSKASSSHRQLSSSSSPKQSNRMNSYFGHHVQSQSLLHLPQMALAGDMAEAPQHHMDNGRGNPIWERNMALLGDMGQRTDEGWFDAEMETSDEEEGSEQTKRKITNSTQRPPWESIPLSLQIEMVYAAVGDDTRAETGLFRLELNSLQRDAMMEKLRHFQEREAIEDANIAKHQTATTEALLTGNKRYSTQEAFKSLLSTHLYKYMDRPDSVATRREVNDARAYMNCCGLDTSFLDGWQLLSTAAYTVTGSDDELDAKYPLAVSMREVMAAERDAIESAIPHAMAPIPPDPLYQSTPVESAEIQSSQSQAESPLIIPSVNDTRPSNQSASRQTTGEVIEVDVGVQRTPSHGKPTPSHPISIPRYPFHQFSAPPQTPQASLSQYPRLAQMPEPVAIPRSVPWPRTPPTPTHPTLPLPASSESDYEPQLKKKRLSTSRKQSVPRKKGDPSPTPGGGAVGETARKMPVSIESIQSNGGALAKKDTREPSSQAATQSSSAPTDDAHSRIVVEIAGQEPVAAEHQRPTTGGAYNQGITTGPKKGKSGRGRGRPKRSIG